MDNPDDLKQRYEKLIENIDGLNKQKGSTLARAVRRYIDEWDELIGVRGVYSVTKAASDLGVDRSHLYTIASRARASARKASKPADAEPRTTRPARNTVPPARDSKADKRPARSVAPKPDSDSADDDDDERPWIESPNDPGIEKRISEDGKFIEKRDKETGRFLGTQIKV